MASFATHTFQNVERRNTFRMKTISTDFDFTAAEVTFYLGSTLVKKMIIGEGLSQSGRNLYIESFMMEWPAGTYGGEVTFTRADGVVVTYLKFNQKVTD